MAKPETIFAAEMRDSFTHYNCAFYHRIEDDAFNAATTHTRKKPFDALCWYTSDDGTIVKSFEYKALNKETRFPFSKIATHQFEGLTNAWKHGAYGYVIVNFRQLPKRKIRTFVISIGRILAWISQGLKSITIEELENDSTLELERVQLSSQTPGWDIRPLTT